MSDAAHRLWRRAQDYLANGQLPAARAVLESLVVRDPAHVRAHVLLGSIAWGANRRDDAVRHAIAAARVVADDSETLCAVIETLVEVGEMTMARELLQRPPLAAVCDGELLMRLAASQRLLGDDAAALALLERSLAVGVEGAEFRYLYGLELSFNGRLRDAEQEFERSVVIGTPPARAWVELARMRKQTPEHHHLRSLDAAVACVGQGSDDHAVLEFARYKELEDLGQHDDAWRALAHGNALMAARMPHDSERFGRLLEGICARCTGDFLRRQDIVLPGPQPIFVIGMTRSGTTLLERILGNHSRVQSAGELGDFSRQFLRQVAGRSSNGMSDEGILKSLPDLDYAEIGRRYLAQTQWRANGKDWYVDKLPGNWQYAGLIRRALPQARLLHMVRNPMDVCFSNYRAFFGHGQAWNYDLDALASHHQQYCRTMAHWHEAMPGQVLDVGYADLVREPESTARKVFAFCGLDWEEGCADLSRNASTVATLSMVQVRAGIRSDAFGEWRPYSARLMRLQARLEGDR